jgi:hypothetical protein
MRMHPGRRVVRVFSTAYNSASIISIVLKWQTLFYLQLGKRKSKGMSVMLFFYIKKIPDGKGSVTQCIVVMQQPVLLLPSSCSHCKCHSSMRNWLFGLQGWIPCEQSPWGESNLWACSWLDSSPVTNFSVLVTLDFPCTVHAFFPESLSNHCHGRNIFSEICTISDAVPLSDPSWSHIRPDKELQIKACKNQQCPPCCMRYCTLTPNKYKQTNKLHGLSPRENYTDRATTACRRSDCQLLRIKSATWSAYPYSHILDFLDRSRYFSIK